MLRRVLNLVFSRIVVPACFCCCRRSGCLRCSYWLADYAKWFGGVGVAMSVIMCLALDPAGFHGAGV